MPPVIKVTHPIIRTQNPGKSRPPRRLTGAALYAKVEAELRRMLADDYGLPMGEYTGEVGQYAPTGYDGEITNLYAVFKRRDHQAEIIINDIFPSDDSELHQYSAPELR
jgi:hypothetical protein